MSSRPLTPILWLSCAFLGGQWLAPWTTGWAFPAAAISGGLVAVTRSPRSEIARLLALCAVAVALGHCQLDGRLQPRLAPSDVAALAPSDVLLRGTIEDWPSSRPSGLRFVLRVDGLRRGGDWQDATGRVLVTTRDAKRDWRRGDRLVARIRLRAPRNFGNPGEFDYEHFLARRAIYTTGYVHSDRDWRRLPRDAEPGWSDAVRRHALATMEQIAPDHLRPVAAALLLGDSASIPPELRRKYARAGVSHVLAVSGLHIGLIAGAAYAACRWLLARSETLLLAGNVPKLATVASLPPLLAYAVIAGPSAATLRATAMVVLFLAALLLDRPRHWPAVVAMAAAVVCGISPGALFEASFQLSFAAVVAIVAGGPRLRDVYDRWAERRLLRLRAPRRHFAERWLFLSQSITVLALMATAPLTLFHFQQFSAVGLLSNVLIVPVTGMAAVSVGLAAVLINPLLPGVGGGLFAASCAFLAVGDAMTGFFARFPAADLHLPTPGVVDIAIYYAILAASLVRSARARTALLVAACLSGGVQAASWIVERTGEDLRLTFASVGQGDCTLIEFPGGHVMLVDGGGLSPTFDVGERLVAPLLLRRKIRSVDTIVVTHPDYDHYGGIPYIAERFRPAEIWSNGSHGRGRRYDEYRTRIADSGARQVTVQRGFERVIGGVTVRALHPSTGRVDASNDSSVVLHLTHGPLSLLLTGDVERGGEGRMVRYADDMHVAIMQVPHHGSRTSSSDALLDATRPSIAIVSSGYRNRYNLPHPTIVERYLRRGIEVLRTDREGAIEVRMTADGSGELTQGQRWRRLRRMQIDAEGRVRWWAWQRWNSPFDPVRATS